jgi:hypothetical protein
MDERQNTILSVLSGSFESQPAAFDRLTYAAKTIGILVGAWDVDVIREAADVRLAHYFRPAIVARIQDLQGDDNTIVVIKPSALSAAPMFPPDESGFRLLGRFAGLLDPSE